MSNEEKKVIEMEDTQVSEEATEITAVSESKGQKVRNFIKKNGKKLRWSFRADASNISWEDVVAVNGDSIVPRPQWSGHSLSTNHKTYVLLRCREPPQHPALPVRSDNPARYRPP